MRNSVSSPTTNSTLFSLAGIAVTQALSADTLLTFDVRPPGQAENAAVIQSFGDNQRNPMIIGFFQSDLPLDEH